MVMRLICSTALLASLIVFACSGSGAPPAERTIQAIANTESSDLAAVLGVRLWKWKVSGAKASRPIVARLELRRRAQPPQPLVTANLILGVAADVDVLASLRANSCLIADAPELTLFLQLRTLGSTRCATKAVPNPFKGGNSLGLYHVSRLQIGDPIVLAGTGMDGSTSPDLDQNDIAIVLNMDVP